MARKTPVRGYGCRICAARETAGFSQAYLAAELGLTRGAAAISNIETEKHEPRFSLVGRISDVLDVSLDSLWGKAEDSYSTPNLESIEALVGREVIDARQETMIVGGEVIQVATVWIGLTNEWNALGITMSADINGMLAEMGYPERTGELIASRTVGGTPDSAAEPGQDSKGGE